MRFFKRVAVVLVLALGLVGVSFAGVNPEWKPFKLGLGPSTPFAPPVPGSAPMIEITIFGGYNSGFGLQTAQNVASDLLTGKHSPWYGAGYPAFFWASPSPADLSADIGGSMLKKDAGAMAGIKLGFNLSEMLQLEAYFSYGFSGYSIDDTVWSDFALAQSKTITSTQGLGRTVVFTDNSLQKAGKTILGGINLNIFFGSGGSVIPYVTLGAGVMSVSDTPLISWSFQQSISAMSSATYTLDVTYAAKMAFLFDAGFGLKFYLGPNYGIKIEGRGNLVMASIDKLVDTGFTATGGWTVFTPYSNTALTEKGTPFFGTGIIGFFFGF